MTQPITILIPAAGMSRRMKGRDKLLEDIDGTPLLRRVVARAAQIGAVRVILTTEQTARAACLDGLAVTITHVDAGHGMGASLAAGAAHLSGPVMIVLPDMPDISAHDMATLVALWHAGAGPILRAAASERQPGHPVILPPELVPKLRALSGDIGAQTILRDHADAVALHVIGPQACQDLDTPEAWAAWRAEQK
ncbi:MAG: nucleotidyltransferase family protein [Pseudomonadota bacterium]